MDGSGWTFPNIPDSYRTTEVFQKLPSPVSSKDRNESSHRQFTDIKKHKCVSVCLYQFSVNDGTLPQYTPINAVTNLSHIHCNDVLW
jgi:hypothetical protein